MKKIEEMVEEQLAQCRVAKWLFIASMALFVYVVFIKDI